MKLPDISGRQTATTPTLPTRYLHPLDAYLFECAVRNPRPGISDPQTAAIPTLPTRYFLLLGTYASERNIHNPQPTFHRPLITTKSSMLNHPNGMITRSIQRELIRRVYAIRTLQRNLDCHVKSGVAAFAFASLVLLVARYHSLPKVRDRGVSHTVRGQITVPKAKHPVPTSRITRIVCQ